MAFQFIGKDGKAKTVGEEKSNRPIRAATRGAIESGLGTYGNILSLLPGYQPGRALPGQMAQAQLEANASPEELPGLAQGAETAPEFGTLPSSSQISSLLDMLGFGKQEESRLEQAGGRFGRGFGGGLAFSTGPLAALSSALTGTGAAELVKSLGGGETLQNWADFLGSLRFGNLSPKQTNKVRQPRLVEKNVSPTKAGFISPERATQVLNRVNEEAAQVASEIGKNQPKFKQISDLIDKNAPIQKTFDSIFEGLETTANNFNSKINTAPLDQFLSKESAKFSNIGAPTDLSSFIMDQINGWIKSGKDDLYSAFRRYRLNNGKIREIIDSVPKDQILSRTNREQIDFLARMNKEIANSFRQSTGTAQKGTSQWVNIFENTNKDYADFLNTKMAKSILDPILEKNVTENQINKFVNNKRNWEDLDRFMGKDESKKLHTLLTDVTKARNAINRFPKKDVPGEILKHTILSKIPGVGSASTAVAIPKIWNWAKGRYFSSPSFQKSFHELTEALIEQNMPAINKAIDKIEREEEKPNKKSSFFVK